MKKSELFLYLDIENMAHRTDLSDLQPFWEHAKNTKVDCE